MAVAEEGSSAVDWAAWLLKASGNQMARNVDRIYLIEVDHGCICFATKGVSSKRFYPRTALIKETARGPVIDRVIDGWPLI